MSAFAERPTSAFGTGLPAPCAHRAHTTPTFYTWSKRARSLYAAGWILATIPLTAAEPTLTHLYPVAGQQGTTVSVTASGKMEPWPAQVWVDAPGISFQAGKTKGKFDVEIAKDAAPGPHLVRVFNEQGASAPRFFIVSRTPELSETEPNDDFKNPQKIAALPATIGGRLDKAGDVDSFAIALKKGERLTAWVEAYVLGSTFDGMLRVVDPQGAQLTFNHDGRTLDPLMVWEAPRDGTFIVQIMGFVYPATAGVGLTGGDGCVYRLHFSTGEKPAAADAALAEQEPNDAATNAHAVTLPGTIAGCIEKSGDEDRFTFTAVKQHLYELKLVSTRVGLPFEAWLKVENKDGKELARKDDARDPQLTWTAPADGIFTVAVGDLTHRGGADFTYRLSLAEAVPAVTATVTSHSLSIAPGKTAEMKVSLRRVNGSKAKLQVVAKNLADGVSAPDVEVAEKAGEATLKFSADAEAKPASQPFQIVVREPESRAESPVQFLLIATAENNGVPSGYTELVVNSTDQLWLTVTGAPAK